MTQVGGGCILQQQKQLTGRREHSGWVCSVLEPIMETRGRRGTNESYKRSSIKRNASSGSQKVRETTLSRALSCLPVRVPQQVHLHGNTGVSHLFCPPLFLIGSRWVTNRSPVHMSEHQTTFQARNIKSIYFTQTDWSLKALQSAQLCCFYEFAKKKKKVPKKIKWRRKVAKWFDTPEFKTVPVILAADVSEMWSSLYWTSLISFKSPIISSSSACRHSENAGEKLSDMSYLDENPIFFAF